MKKVQSDKNAEKTLDELFRRYRQSTTTYDHSKEYAEHKSRELSARSEAPKSYKRSSADGMNFNKYRNGTSTKGKYMTEGDFANYYKETREYTPQSNVELDTVILLQKIDRARYKKDGSSNQKPKNDIIKRKLKLEANRASASVPGIKPIAKRPNSKAK